MNVKFLTFGQGHLVSDREYDRLKKGFAKVGVNLYHNNDGEQPVPDIVMVKGFSHTWNQLNDDFPVVYYSIGTEWKVGVSPETNEPIRELYQHADAVVHVSQYCMDSHHAIFPFIQGKKETVIIPAEEPKLSDIIMPMQEPLRLATTCIPRPVKRSDQLEELCKKHNIQLVPAWGGVTDFSYYHDCDGYIHLSRKEGMPNTVLEALAYGLPCIVTNYGGAKEAVGDAGIIIKNDSDGVAWDPNNILPVDEILFVEAINEFKRRFPELRLKARQRVLSELNDYIMACKFKEVFESCLR